LHSSSRSPGGKLLRRALRSVFDAAEAQIGKTNMIKIAYGVIYGGFNPLVDP
jgi:hypothetical protein